MAIKIFHAADLHLGAVSKRLGKLGKERSREILQSFFHLLDVCQEEGVEVLLLAGDILEGSDIASSWVEEIKDRLAGRSFRVFLSPGNHDYYAPGSFYDGSWPKNVTIFKHAYLDRVDVEELDLSIYGAAFRSTYQRRSMLTNLSWEEEEKRALSRRILLVHGDWETVDSPYHSILAQELPADFFSYVALGHIHKRSPILRLGQSQIAYSGSFDANSYQDQERKGIYQVLFSDLGLEVTFRPFSSRLFFREKLDLSGVSSQAEAKTILLEKIQSLSDQPSRDFFRFVLEGYKEEETFDPLLLAQDLAPQVHALDLQDQRKPAPDWEAMAQEENLRGYFLRLLQEERKKADPSRQELLDLALDYGLAAFAGKEL